jgi:hypothetical protein
MEYNLTECRCTVHPPPGSETTLKPAPVLLKGAFSIFMASTKTEAEGGAK